MKKNMIDFELITAVVQTAIKKEYEICAGEQDIAIFYNERQIFNFYIGSRNHLIATSSKGEIRVNEEVNETFKLKFKLLCKECEKYSNNMFFKEVGEFLTPPPTPVEPVQEKTINDLDDEE